MSYRLSINSWLVVCLIRDVNIYEFFNIHFSYDHVIEHFEVSAGKISTLCTDEIRAPLVKEPLKNRARRCCLYFYFN